MRRAAGIGFGLALLSLAACAYSPHDSATGNDRLRRVAVSWVGAPLEDMIAAWGEPSQYIIEASADRNGLVQWRDSWSTGAPALAADGYRCIVEARYALNRTILRVDTISHDCDTQSSGDLDRLTYRPN